MLGLGNSISTSTYVSSEGEALLLDTYGDSAAAYSLRKLSSSYSGEVLQVRRAFDHVEVDVGFDANGLLSLDSPVTNVVEESTGVTQGSSTSATKFGEFCGDASYAKVDSMTEASHVEIVTWYDQSGNANNATQVAAANQPRIYDRTTGVVTENGKPAVDFTASVTSLNNTSFKLNPVPISMLVVAQFPTGGTFQHIVDQSQGSSAGFLFTRQNSADYRTWYYPNLTNQLLGNTTSTAQSLHSLMIRNGEQVYNLDGTSQHTGTTAITNNTIPTNDFVIGTDPTNDTRQFLGKAQEFVFYLSNQKDNFAGIETNINTFYSIY